MQLSRVYSTYLSLFSIFGVIKGLRERERERKKERKKERNKESMKDRGKRGGGVRERGYVFTFSRFSHRKMRILNIRNSFFYSKCRFTFYLD